LRRIEGKIAIDYAQNFDPKCEFQKYIKLAANFAPFYGINKNYLLRLAYRLAEANSVSHNFEIKNGTAEKTRVYYIFLKRYPTADLRQLEATSVARVRGQ
jgi:hypothetical protein